MIARVLIIAGSDSGSGAGIQADLKTVSALGGYATTAITALTAQNTHGVFGVHPIPADFVAQQIRLVLSDIGADCIKTGMLVDASIITAVAVALDHQSPPIPLVVDPVMVSKNGRNLLDPLAVSALISKLFPKADLITPNIPEAEALLGVLIKTEKDQSNAARDLLSLGAKAVLLKGGHASGSDVVDILATPNSVTRFASPRLPGRATHGTGCTLASALATSLAQGNDLNSAIILARDFVQRAIMSSPQIGSGHPILDHFHSIRTP